jgi:hypothetical protein
MFIAQTRPARAVLLSTLLLAVSLPIAAQDPVQSGGSTEAAQGVSAEAKAVLNRMTATLRGLKSFEIESYPSSDEVNDLGYKLQNNEHAVLTVSQPNKLRSVVKGDIRNRTFIYDGAKLTIYSPDDNVYARVDAPDTITKLVGGLLNAGIDMPMIDMLYQTGAGTLTEQVRGGILVGESMIEGVACDHLAFRQSTIDWQLWVEKGSRALPRKILITTRHEAGAPQYQAIMRWNLQPKIDASTFAFTPPKGVNEIPYSEPASLKDVPPAGDR